MHHNRVRFQRFSAFTESALTLMRLTQPSITCNVSLDMIPQKAFSFIESVLNTQHKNVSLHFLYILIFKYGHVFKSQGDYMHRDATVVGGLPNFLITKGQKRAGFCVIEARKIPGPKIQSPKR